MLKGKTYFVNDIVVEDGIKMLHVKSSETNWSGTWKYNMLDLMTEKYEIEWIPMKANLDECKKFYSKNAFTDWEYLETFEVAVEYKLCEKGFGYKSAKVL